MATKRLILAAEDEETDAFLLRISLKESGLSNPLVIARDGQAVVDYLTGAPPHVDRSLHPLPGLMLLDLKMPRMDGFEVLAWLAARPEFRDLPTVVLSSSSDEADIRRARQMGARDYLVKPHDYRKLAQMLLDVVERFMVDTPPV
jgi:CheY-like chemotaxis protein